MESNGTNRLSLDIHLTNENRTSLSIEVFDFYM